ncbi:MAG: cytochrome c [Pseudomonadota bacterium]|jgi:hypothetical protein|nr:cytochrome c [Pseudomonadota bacterium]MEC8956606.1 cytochrome c [Pseudomonadota bacterium]
MDYLLHCSGCHLADGSGLPPVIPDLRRNLGFIVSRDKGRGYLVRVPGSSSAPLDNSELAELINWVLEAFNTETLPNNFTPLTTDEVRKSRKNVLMDPLKFRASLFKTNHKVSALEN